MLDLLALMVVGAILLGIAAFLVVGCYLSIAGCIGFCKETLRNCFK